MTRTQTAILAAIIAGGAMLGLSVAEPVNPAASSAPHIVVTDGDSLRIDGKRVRLFGIDAPELRQTCMVPRGSWECGRAATNALHTMIAEDPAVTCERRDTDRYGRMVAVCRNSGGDLGARMVRAGHAVDYTRYSGGAYREHEAAAKAERLGVHAGSFQHPADWRKEHTQ